MWIMTTLGFFSVVAHRNEPLCLLVRARSQDHLEALRREMCARLKMRAILMPIVATPMADYPFRMTVTRATFTDWLSVHADGIEYDNFKNAVAKQPTPKAAGRATNAKYLAALHEVWAIMRKGLLRS